MTRRSGPAKASVIPRARRARLITRELPEETLVYDLETSRAHCLGRLAAAVWRRCDGRADAARIAAGVRRETGADIDEGGVRIAVERLGDARLLESRPPAVGASRRELLKKAAILGGLTVASITAPLSVEAATCVTGCNTRPNTPPGNCGAIPCCPPDTGRCCRQAAGSLCRCRNVGGCTA